MENPWQEIPRSPPFVLDCDKESVDQFNQSLAEDSPYWLHTTDLIPEPFIGAVHTAPVLVLQLNPGRDEADPVAHTEPSFRSTLLANLRHEPSEWPFYFLDPRFSQVHPGGRWWKPKLRMLLQVLDVKHLAHNLGVVEWFPYKSAKFKHGCKTPSQEYGFELVRSAIHRGSLIIVSRAIKQWESSVPELATYERKLTLSSKQNVALTPNNLKLKNTKCPEAWQMLIEALQS